MEDGRGGGQGQRAPRHAAGRCWREPLPGTLTPGAPRADPGTRALPPWRGVFLTLAQSLSESGLMWAFLMPRIRQGSGAVNVDRGQLVG
jgi:hypothetical protein